MTHSGEREPEESEGMDERKLKDDRERTSKPRAHHARLNQTYTDT